MSLAPSAPLVVAVLDTPGAERKLSESASGTPFEVREASSFPELVGVLRSERAPLGLVAFEALWPHPQRMLTDLRKQAPDAQSIVAYSPGSPREQLLQRLWAVGLVDHLASRDAAADVGRVLRQAYADALAEGIRRGAPGPREEGRQTSLAFLRRLAAAFANQRSVDGLMRELYLGLPEFLEHDLLQVTVLEDGRPKIYVVQTRPVDHELVWLLAEEQCTALSPLVPRKLSASDAVMVDMQVYGAAPGRALCEVGAASHRIACLPMMLGGTVVGALGLLVPTAVAIDEERQTTLRLVAHQLAVSLRHAQLIADADRASLVDELTQAGNRRYLASVLPREWERATRYRRPLTAIMLDLDRFKALNDALGRLAGDALLASAGAAVRAELRRTDHAVRWGDDEFLLLLPDTSPGDALAVVERARSSIATRAGRDVLAGSNLRLGTSAGVAGVPACAAASAEELIELAARALAEAKRAGGGRVHLAHGAPAGVYASADPSAHVEPRAARPVAAVILPPGDLCARVTRVVAAAGYQVRAVSQVAGLREDAALVVAGAAALRDEQGGVTRLRERSGLSPIVVLDETVTRQEALEAFQLHRMDHLISAGDVLEESLLATIGKLTTGDLFGIEPYLQQGVRSRAWTLLRPGDKETALANLHAWTVAAGCREVIADLLMTSVDEMLINALYRPGPDGAGKPVAIRCGSDGRLLGISVADGFGRLRKEDVHASLAEAISRQRAGVPASAQSGRLGFRIMLETLSKLAVNVEAGRRTEIVGLVDLRKSLREYRGGVPCIGLFFRER